MANTTKRMLALCLKNQLTHTTLDNITIRELTDEAGVSRKTFYYHFHDIYDLLEWTLIDDASLCFRRAPRAAPGMELCRKSSTASMKTGKL